MQNFFELFNLRFEFEEITKDYSMSVEGSDIDTIEWFLENGHRSNSLRNGFGRAKEIALAIKEIADGCAKETRAELGVREV